MLGERVKRGVIQSLDAAATQFPAESDLHRPSPRDRVSCAALSLLRYAPQDVEDVRHAETKS